MIMVIVVMYGSLLGPLKKYIYIFIFFLRNPKNLKKKKKKKKKLSQDPRSEIYFFLNIFLCSAMLLKIDSQSLPRSCSLVNHTTRA